MAKLSLYLATLLLGSNFSATTATPGGVSAPPPDMRATAIEQRFVDLTNAERWDRDLRVLAPNALLTAIARAHSREMAEMNYFDHVSPTPGQATPLDRYLTSLERRPTWVYVGENLVYCSVTDADLGHSSLMNSPKHRDNILNPRFEQIGVGAYMGVDGKMWVTEMFLAQID